MSNPVRMCIGCKGRFLQNKLLRLQYKESKLLVFSGKGRSFYLCRECGYSNKTLNALIKICKVDKKTNKNLSLQLKEILLYGESPYQRDC